MNICAFSLLRALCLFCFASSVIAGEQRVLMSFDNSGHQVRHIVMSQSPSTIRPSVKSEGADQHKLPDIETLITQLEPGVALLVWKDEDGYSFTSTEEPDPRVSHAPAHIQGFTESRLGQSAGAWLVVGPDSATSIIILLPADLALGLGFEQWDVSLVMR